MDDGLMADPVLALSCSHPLFRLAARNSVIGRGQR